MMNQTAADTALATLVGEITLMLWRACEKRDRASRDEDHALLIDYAEALNDSATQLELIYRRILDDKATITEFANCMRDREQLLAIALKQLKQPRVIVKYQAAHEMLVTVRDLCNRALAALTLATKHIPQPSIPGISPGMYEQIEATLTRDGWVKLTSESEKELVIYWLRDGRYIFDDYGIQYPFAELVQATHAMAEKYNLSEFSVI